MSVEIDANKKHVLIIYMGDDGYGGLFMLLWKNGM